MITSKKVILAILFITAVCGGVYAYMRDKNMRQYNTDQDTSLNPGVPAYTATAPKEIIWNRYENQELGISFYYPPQTNISESSYNTENGATYYVTVYDPIKGINVFNIYLQSLQCPYSGVIGNDEIIASTTFKHTVDRYPDYVYDRYMGDKNGGCYNLSTTYKKSDVASKEDAMNVLRSFRFLEI